MYFCTETALLEEGRPERAGLLLWARFDRDPGVAAESQMLNASPRQQMQP